VWKHLDNATKKTWLEELGHDEVLSYNALASQAAFGVGTECGI
jgi:hypothetical protein